MESKASALDILKKCSIDGYRSPRFTLEVLINSFKLTTAKLKFGLLPN
jgi:hypothetical protein